MSECLVTMALVLAVAVFIICGHNTTTTEGSSTTICVYDTEKNFNHQNTCTFKVLTSSVSTLQLPDGNFTIWFQSDIQLSSNVSIVNKTRVNVKGMPSKISCNENVGIYINKVENLKLEDIELTSCGTSFRAPSLTFFSSLYVLDCKDITVTRLSINRSKGNGMTMINNQGIIVVQNSSFSQNKDIYTTTQRKETEVGSGLRIIISYCPPRHLKKLYECPSSVNDSHYRILHNNFSNNNDGKKVVTAEWTNTDSDQVFPDESEYIAEGFGRGGGLSVVVDLRSFNNRIQIDRCRFVNNSAIWGGGIYIIMQEESLSNTLEVTNSMFQWNRCNHLAGGAAIIGYQANFNDPQNNSITFENCTFKENVAGIGGGVSFFSSPSSNLSNKVSFRSCNWTENMAMVGAAINIAPQVWSSFVYDIKTDIEFSDCIFASNYLKNSNISAMKLYKSYKRGRGTFSAVGYRIILKGAVLFDGNMDSAMNLLSTDIIFKSNANVTFSNNKGLRGGAIYMQGVAALILEDNLNIWFLNNTAERIGGAVFQHTDNSRDFLASRSCFIRYKGKKRNVTERNITLFFRDNIAGDIKCGRNCSKLGVYGHSIYATTLSPCFNSWDCKNIHNSCIASFHFQNYSSYDLSSSGKVTNGTNRTVWAVPGKVVYLPVETLNDMQEEVFTIYYATIKLEGNRSLSVKNSYLFDKSAVFLGEPSAEASLILKTADGREILYILRLILLECPPGFVYSSRKMKCECSTRSSKHFPGIETCDEEEFEAKLVSGFWLGYDHLLCNDTTSDAFGAEKNLRYATCPRRQCYNDKNIHDRKLPETTSVCSLEQTVCVDNRTGVLCSRCKDGFAAHYRDETYSCKSLYHNNCRWGWLLYIVSEIVPVTLFFFVIMFLNIKLTSGSISGLILYFQLTHTMLVRANGFISFPRYSETALNVYFFITGIFNLNFFAMDSLSFCLWKSASSLDLIAFKYLTILFSSTLVALVIAILKYNRSKCLNDLLIKLRNESAHSTKNTIIHAISGFLVICYSECTRISLLLLSFAHLQTPGGTVKKVVPFYDGELEYLHGKHLLYALPAFCISLLLGVLPPLLLISYPLCYKVLGFLKLSESRASRILCIIFPLEKFRPFFDSFQSSFKDDFRFFSGLYFLYRSTTLLVISLRSDLIVYYALLQVLLVLILAVHAVCQPYKKRSYNIIDTLLFLILSAINAITVLNYYLSMKSAENQVTIDRASVAQVVLLYLPLLISLCFLVKKSFPFTKKGFLLAREKKVHFKRLRHSSNSEKIESKTSVDLGYLDFSRSFSLSTAEKRQREDDSY